MRSLLTVTFLLALVLPASAQTTWYVDGHGCDGSGTGAQGDPFCTVQEGVDVATDGDTLIVRAGFYPELVVLRPIHLTIRGATFPNETTLGGFHDWPDGPILRIPARSAVSWSHSPFHAAISHCPCRIGTDPY
jgi:hypothetical protein